MKNRLALAFLVLVACETGSSSIEIPAETSRPIVPVHCPFQIAGGGLAHGHEFDAWLVFESDADLDVFNRFPSTARVTISIDGLEACEVEL
jgi:hypothetical protein